MTYVFARVCGLVFSGRAPDDNVIGRLFNFAQIIARY
jgi:hypothetical protein